MATTSASIRRARPLLGTFVEIAVAQAPFPGMEATVEAAFAAVAAVHRLMSFHEADSDVSRLNRSAAAGTVRVHDWTYQVLETALDLHRHSGGIFDIAVAPALQRLGLLPGATFCSGEGRTRDTIDLLPERRVRFAHRGLLIDLGGIAKGFAVDCAIEALRRHGITEGLVNAGGDLAAFGVQDHLVHIRDPARPDRTMCRVTLNNAALATSAGRLDPLQFGAPSSAIIDPATARPVRAILGASVCASHCVIADALTKVVMNLGQAAAPALRHYGANALLVTAAGEVHATASWTHEVRLAA
jgi:thiamine biosynthesis lipoprotein